MKGYAGTILFEPASPLHFGDGRPKDAGEASFAASRFPPSPRTIQGALRTALLSSVEGLELGNNADQAEIEALVGPPDRLPEGWQFAGPWLVQWHEETDEGAIEVEMWLPMPSWFELAPARPEPKGSKSQRPRLQPRLRHWQPIVPREGRAPDPKKLSIRLDLAEGYEGLLVGLGGQSRAWVAGDDIASILRGKLPNRPHLGWLPPFVARSFRTGLVLDGQTRRAEDSMLYTIETYQFAPDSGLAVAVNIAVSDRIEPSILEKGISRLGGKRGLARRLRGATWSSSLQPVLEGEHLPHAVPENSRFFLWATTPVRAANPLDPGLTRLRAGGSQLKVLSAAVGPREHMGGFSLARNLGAPTHSYLPPGSAWLVEVVGGGDKTRAQLLRNIHNTCCLGDDEHEQAFGFGHVLVGRAPMEWRES